MTRARRFNIVNRTAGEGDGSTYMVNPPASASAETPPPSVGALAAPRQAEPGVEAPAAAAHAGTGMASKLGALAALVALIGWTALFVTVQRSAIASDADGGYWLGWITLWSGPAGLIGIGWLVLARVSPRQARRFGDAARLLDLQAERLAHRMLMINRELAQARAFLEEQSQAIEAMGQSAVERLTQQAGQLTELVQANAEHVAEIDRKGVAALANMDRLAEQMPAIAASASEVTERLGEAGRRAQDQLKEMTSQINRFADVTHSCDDLVGAIGARLTEMIGQLEASRETLGQEEAESLLSLRARLGALRDEVTTVGRGLREQEAGMLAVWNSARAEITREMAALDSEITRRHAAQTAQLAEFGNRGAAARVELEAIDTRLRDVASAADSAEAALKRRLDLLGSHLSEGRRTLIEIDASVSALSDSSVRLLELLQSSAQHSRENLPRAISEGERRLSDVEARAVALREAMQDASAKGEDLSRYVLETREGLSATLNELDHLHDSITEKSAAHGTTVSRLRDALAALEAENRRVASQASDELASAIASLSGAAREALSELEERGGSTVSAVAQRLGAESGAAIDRAMRLHTAQVSGQLEQAAAHAAGVSMEATTQLRDQLDKVQELVGDLEERVTQARARAMEQVDNDFTRRSAAITEALNSASVNIAKALSTEVADTAWAAYLRGDRGIFTRRTVKLLGNAEAKTVAQLYEDDTSFRDSVSHYIHDFEGMLRQLLATRDGHAIGVTLLSSDLGKLYVALAQAIERLRK